MMSARSKSRADGRDIDCNMGWYCSWAKSQPHEELPIAIAAVLLNSPPRPRFPRSLYSTTSGRLTEATCRGVSRDFWARPFLQRPPCQRVPQRLSLQFGARDATMHPGDQGSQPALRSLALSLDSSAGVQPDGWFTKQCWAPVHDQLCGSTRAGHPCHTNAACSQDADHM